MGADRFRFFGRRLAAPARNGSDRRRLLSVVFFLQFISLSPPIPNEFTVQDNEPKLLEGNGQEASA